jgi:hypothetical protein
VSPQAARSALALQRGAQLTGMHPTALAVLVEANRALTVMPSDRRIRLIHRLAGEAAAAPARELSRGRAARVAGWCAGEALRHAGVHDETIEKPLTAMAAGEPVSLIAVADALVALERLGGGDKALVRACYACELTLGLSTTNEDWRERLTLACRHATGSFLLSQTGDMSGLERFFGGLVRRLADAG